MDTQRLVGMIAILMVAPWVSADGPGDGGITVPPMLPFPVASQDPGYSPRDLNITVNAADEYVLTWSVPLDDNGNEVTPSAYYAYFKENDDIGWTKVIVPGTQTTAVLGPYDDDKTVGVATVTAVVEFHESDARSYIVWDPSPYPPCDWLMVEAYVVPPLVDVRPECLWPF